MSLEYFDYMKTNKDSLHNIIKNVRINNVPILDILHDAIFRINKIVIHTYNFLKLYILHLYNENSKLPLIDRYFIQTIMKIVSDRKGTRGAKPNKDTIKLINKLTVFYNKFYVKTLNKDDIVNDDGLGQMLAYEAIDIVSNTNTNIQEHFIQHVRKFINVIFKWKKRIRLINEMEIDANEKKKRMHDLYVEFNDIIHDVLNVSDKILVSKKKYHIWIKKNKYSIIPQKDKYKKDSVHYDVCCDPQDYLRSMIYINEVISTYSTEENPIKLFHALPLRTRIIPNYVTFDTASLVSLLIVGNVKDYYFNIKDKQKELWSKFFHTNKKVFKKTDYTFDFMIKTDGVGCSILFVKLDENGQRIKRPSKVLQNKLNNIKENKDKDYIEEQPNIKKILKNKNYVCIDPNASDLMYCMDKTGTKFRYTQNQRRMETKNKKYMKIVEEINSETRINNKSVKEIEAELSKHNSKTCDFAEFFNYLKKKNEINRLLFDQKKFIVN